MGGVFHSVRRDILAARVAPGIAGARRLEPELCDDALGCRIVDEMAAGEPLDALREAMLHERPERPPWHSHGPTRLPDPVPDLGGRAVVPRHVANGPDHLAIEQNGPNVLAVGEAIDPLDRLILGVGKGMRAVMRNIPIPGQLDDPRHIRSLDGPIVNRLLRRMKELSKLNSTHDFLANHCVKDRMRSWACNRSKPNEKGGW